MRTLRAPRMRALSDADAADADARMRTVRELPCGGGAFGVLAVARRPGRDTGRLRDG
ncbi:hypothetical protein SCA03_00910 [Streptomyces cacaoi]|uniref:Uncharacterized protein n=1 Tax=Streptomyces cacaoi TaxID=1898 RepID=A0A4Y3QU40_STRCI|nr:hypothetical protein SCA03_00910 [Streptomyces cacaoi]